MQTIENRTQLALLQNDVLQSFRKWQFWGFLGWNDIAKQYRRSFIGPVWITLNSAIFIVAFGLVGAQLFKFSVEDYLPYFCAGQIFFSFMSSLINEGCDTYINAHTFLKQTAYPKFAFVLRVVWRNLLLLGHNLAVIIAVLLWAGRLSQVQWLPFLAGLLVTILAACFVVAIFGAIAARYRDVPMMVASIMQVSFFVTPVMWRPDQLTERAQWLVHLNPLACYLEILRQPLLGLAASQQAWLTAVGLLAVLCVAFILLYRQVRRRIVYWL
ncbi:MAG: ABC transporter permease [Hydrogenophilales bacterium]|nr:ABC transporter permease [Hydrogenophilales bacterium]